MAETAPEVIDRIKRDLKTGMGIRAIARRHGESHQTVIRIRDEEHASCAREAQISRCPVHGTNQHPVQIAGQTVSCLPCYIEGTAQRQKIA